MADTASNQGKAIATKGTAHIPRTAGPTDVCINPAVPVTAPFPNFVPTTRLGAGQTIRTKIDNKPIWTMKGVVGPPSNAPHPPFVIGAVSGKPYQMEAKPIMGSTNVFAEGGALIRTNDPTFQNAMNTVGFVDGSRVAGNATNEQGFLQKICTLVVFEGACEHGRKLGFPAPGGKGEPSYLEVLSGDTIKFKAERQDTTKSPPEKEPKCRLGGNHTKWIAKRVGSVPAVTPKTKEGTGTEFEVGPDFTDLSLNTLLGIPIPGTVSDGAAHTPVDHSDTGGAKVKISTSTWVSPVKWFLMWKIRENPPVITVQALACAGSKTATIKVFPTQGIKASLFAEQTDDITKGFLAKIEKCKKIAEIVQKITRIAGHEIKVEFLISPKVEFELQYVECKEEKGYYSTIYTPARVNRKWSLTIGFDPLIGVQGSIKIPLLTFLPGLGPAMAKIINYINRKYPTFAADIVFGFKIGFSCLYTVGQDEYDAPSNTGGKGKVAIELSMALELGIAGFKIQFKAAFPAEVSLGLFLGDTPKVLLQLVIEGSIKSAFTIILFPDSWYEWEVAKAEPDWLKWEPDAKRVDLIAAP